MSEIDDGRLEEWLRASEPYLADDGFTARVMLQLPPRRRDVRPWVLLGATAVGAGAAFGIAPSGTFLLDTLGALSQWRPGMSLPVLSVALLALLIAGSVALARGDV